MTKICTLKKRRLMDTWLLDRTVIGNFQLISNRSPTRLYKLNDIRRQKITILAQKSQTLIRKDRRVSKIESRRENWFKKESKVAKNGISKKTQPPQQTLPRQILTLLAWIMPSLRLLLRNKKCQKLQNRSSFSLTIADSTLIKHQIKLGRIFLPMPPKHHKLLTLKVRKR